MALLAVEDVIFLTAAGVNRYCLLDGYDHTASCKGSYVPYSCRDEKVLPAGTVSCKGEKVKVLRQLQCCHVGAAV